MDPTLTTSQKRMSVYGEAVMQQSESWRVSEGQTHSRHEKIHNYYWSPTGFESCSVSLPFFPFLFPITTHFLVMVMTPPITATCLRALFPSVLTQPEQWKHPDPTPTSWCPSETPAGDGGSSIMRHIGWIAVVRVVYSGCVKLGYGETDKWIDR